jgi:Holliday junction resolvasome RuvABC ATP-dependent DNA helicase subunit
VKKQGLLKKFMNPPVEGFIRRTSRGREATDIAYSHLGLRRKKSGPSAQKGIFD